ncbi:protein kinase domain-containing protein [Pendulispora albinea]|uniref:Protein kinase n=1 Tax=Pendulispora albinea TaxID=2741071 RepID=A0ABZ2M7K4_9BACT
MKSKDEAEPPEAHWSSAQRPSPDEGRGGSPYTITDSVRVSVDNRTLVSVAPPKTQPALGWRLGGADGTRFLLLERLGGGGMSIVFLARDTVLDRRVAIKFLVNEARSTPEGLERLQLEARACARLNHENIVRLFDMGIDRGIPFLVMEYLEGRPLDEVVREGAVDARRVVRIMADVAKGLSQAHRAGITHRDLKPSNVFIAKDGTAKILDFGVAIFTHEPGAMNQGLWGTPRYMSPEQWKGEPQDGRSDIWAVGVMFFELLTGSAPFDGSTITEIRDDVISPQPAPSLRAIRPEMPEEADWIAQRSMMKRAADRFGTADELLDALVKLQVALTQVMRARTDDTNLRAAPKPEMRQVTVLSCAPGDAPELMDERGLEEATALLHDFFEVCSTVVRELEGTILLLLGPRFVACFGYPTTHEDNAPRALRAATLIVDAMQGRGGARIGVATSLSIARRTGHASASVAFQAEALHVAQGLEGRAGRNEILIGHTTEALVRSNFELERCEETRETGRCYRVLRPTNTRFDGIADGHRIPLVGRERELEVLRELSERVKAGKGQFVWIAGEAGIGKSRLVAQHLERAAVDSQSIVRCQCWPHFQNSALEPIFDGILRKLGLRRDAPAHEKLGLLEAALAAASLSLPEHLPLLARFLGIPTGDRDAPLFISPDLLRRRMQSILATLLEHMALQRPLVLLVEDAHWSDTSTLDLLEVLLDRMVATRAMVLVTARPEFDPSWPRSSHLHRMALARLSSEEVGAMIAFASQGRSLPSPIVEQLVQRTDGVPLFVEELTRSVADAFHEAEQRGLPIPLDAFASGSIPATLEDLLRARLGALSREGQDVARVAAVLDRDATYDMIRMISGLAEASLRIGLMQLVETGILRRQAHGTSSAYAFKHALVRDAAYRSLVKNERREVHRRAAEMLVEHFPESIERHPELAAMHFMEAGRHEQAAIYFERAGERASDRLANTDAAAHYALAIAQLRMLAEGEARDGHELSLQLARGMALMAANGPISPDVQAPYARVRELAPLARGRDIASFQSLFGLNQFYLGAGDLEAAAEVARDLIALADEAGDEEMWILARAALGPCLSFLGDFVEARRCLEAGFALYDVRKHGKLAMRIGFDPGVTLGLLLGEVLWFLGYPDRALERSREVVSLAREVGHPFSLGLSLEFLANCCGYRGAYDELRGVADEAIVTSDKYGLRLVSTLGRGWARIGTGDRSGIEDIERSVADYRTLSIRLGFPQVLAVLAWAQWQIAAFDDALRTLDEMAAFIEATGERQFEAEMFRLRGEVSMALGADPSLSQECFERGLTVARRQRARGLELRLAYGYARLLMNQSRPAAARELLAPIVAHFTEGSQTVDVRRARELLATL